MDDVTTSRSDAPQLLLGGQGDLAAHITAHMSSLVEGLREELLNVRKDVKANAHTLAAVEARMVDMREPEGFSSGVAAAAGTSAEGRGGTSTAARVVKLASQRGLQISKSISMAAIIEDTRKATTSKGLTRFRTAALKVKSLNRKKAAAAQHEKAEVQKATTDSLTSSAKIEASNLQEVGRTEQPSSGSSLWAIAKLKSRQMLRAKSSMALGEDTAYQQNEMDVAGAKVSLNKHLKAVCDIYNCELKRLTNRPSIHINPHPSTHPHTYPPRDIETPIHPNTQCL